MSVKDTLTVAVSSVKGSLWVEYIILRPSYAQGGLKICGATSRCNFRTISMLRRAGILSWDGVIAVIGSEHLT